MRVQVGDLLYMSKDQAFPCDIVVLRTARDDGLCFVETSQLDGYGIRIRICTRTHANAQMNTSI